MGRSQPCPAGADIIVDDIGYLLAPAFQDGVIAQAVSAVVADGCSYFSSAGNGGNLNDGTSGVWEGDFAAGPALSLSGVKTGAVYHDFDPDPDNAVTRNEIVKDSPLPISLQWADPVGGSANDYDLFLIDTNNTVIVSSTNTQDGSQDPIEYISGACSNDYEGARLVIVKNAGAADRYLRLNTGGELAIATAGQTFGHSASQDAIGVAAVSAQTAGGAGGVFNGTESVETFSSDGPRRMFFEANGTPVTPGNFSSTGGELLQKPDLTAADAVSTSTPGFATFKGTSAAAPHAAGIAALMLEAAGGPAKVTLDELHTAMTRTESVVDIEEMGVDRDSGAGIVMAPGAVAAVAVDVGRNLAPTVESALTDQPFEPGDDPVTIDLDDVFDDPNNDPLTYTMQLLPDTPTVTLAGSMLTLAPTGPSPPVVVTVRATDPDGLTRTQTFTVTVTAGNQDYDVDNDNLIDVSTLAQLDAIRYDLNGDGWVDGATWQPYYAAFDQGAAGMGCPDGCVGYELAADLDFDTNDSSGPDDGDDYWNGGTGWEPIGSSLRPFAATFDGNGQTIANLFIEAYLVDYKGLFGVAGPGSVIRSVGLTRVEVQGDNFVDVVGGLVGDNHGVVSGCYVAGRVTGANLVGGLVGLNRGVVAASYATGRVTGALAVGGLVGANRGTVVASYATGRVTGRSGIGGLVGLLSGGTVEASYAIGRVSGTDNVGGLLGSTGIYGGDVTTSYWDTRTSGLASSDQGQGYSTGSLQAPTGYTGLYRAWSVDLDGDRRRESPWHFGTAAQYPVLALDVDGNGQTTWQEMGYQLRESPTLRASGQPTQVSLTWTAVDVSYWTPEEPTVRYTLFRDAGATTEILAEELDGVQYTDTSVTTGSTYTYQVAAVVSGSEAMWSARVTVTARRRPPPPPPPPPPGPGGGGGGDSRDLHGDTPAQATRVRLGSSVPWASSTVGQINTPDDIDYFQFSLPHAGVLVVETTGSTDTVGTVWRTGEELASADSGGVRRNFRLSTRVAAGSVVVAVEGNGSQTGDYTLETRLLVGYLENPGAASFQSGVGVLSGWVCEANRVEIEIGAFTPQVAAYGTERRDTAGVCGDTDNGFGLLFNWNLLGDGEHAVVALVDGVELSRATVTVTTLGVEFLRNVAGTCEVENFPRMSETVTLVWQQNTQNFVIAGGRPPVGATPGRSATVTGYLENPGANSFQSGVGVLSGWVCTAERVEIEIGHLGRQVAGYGTERRDTLRACGDVDNGFGLLFNWNLLGDGEHPVVAWVDDIELGRATVRVTTVGHEFLRGAEGECVVEDFPMLGEMVTLEWQQNSQNFVITDVE